MNIEQLTDLYLAIKISNPRTARNYDNISRRFSLICEHSSIDEIDYSHIKNWKDNILERATTTTWNTYLRHMKALFNFARKKDYISTNPFADIAFAPKLKTYKKTIQNGTIQDIIRIINHEPDRYPPYWFWTMVSRFLYITGIRRRQLVHITWEHIDFNNKTLLVCADGSKNKKERKLPLVDLLIKDLEVLLKQHRSNHKTVQSDQVFNVTLFNTKYRGVKTKVDQISGFYRRLTKNSELTVSPHRFRHTMATELGNLPDTNIFVLSDILGHSDLRITREYVETNIEPLRELMNKLEQNLTKK